MIPYNCLNYDNSKVTLELRDMVKNGVKIWDFDYPSYYKDADKTVFEQKVIDHFYFRQIGMETPARWLHYFRTRIREIMPYYIQLYKSVELMESVEDPFEAYNLTEEFTRTHSNQGNTTGTTKDETSSTATGSNERTLTGSHDRDGNSDSVRKHSDTPQGSIDNLDDYLTDGTVENVTTGETVTDSETVSEDSETSTNIDGRTSTSATSTGSGEESYRLTRRGNIGVQPLGKEVQALREAFINIDMMIIHELNDLFLMVY